MTICRSICLALVVGFTLATAEPAISQSTPNSEEFFRQLALALQDPAERQKVKAALNSWSPEQRLEFSSSLSEQVQKTLIPKLPMQIDKVTIWRSLRMTDTAMYADIVVLDPSLSDPNRLAIEESTIKNHMCTTPANALLLMLGYKFFLSYYDQSSRYITQLQYTAGTCGL